MKALKSISLIVLSILAVQSFAQVEDMAGVEVLNDVEFNVENKQGAVTIHYSSEIPEDIELQFLTRSGAIIWSKMLYGYAGKEKEKLDFLIPEGSYVTRVYHGKREVTRRVVFN